ncbi:aconitase X [Candidatus Formimonas warabiya]|uniref:Phosphomevalonate dehydratase large subunit-like domain-containing protein n=1 Tax=Formimonas warabiya TaxID=1761012 RepID=A0A3G1KRZ1_FORW1|nr:aconitase X catalytic domain-containing protein [Candidatus Formimonas warabiya]ATW25154.1 hypothetical protein DCMF_10580 [Candidatus Formimonas warabiya]
MKLTDDEKRLLDGSEGKLKQKAMEFIVKYAQVLGAEELCQVTKATLFCGAHPYLEVFKSEDIDLIISEMCFCSSEKVILDKMACYCQSCVSPMDPEKWAHLGVSEEEYQKNQEFLRRYLAAGVHLTGTCAPYLVGFIPLMGEHFVTSESSVVLILNSLWGACGNGDGIEAGFCAAVCGRTPLWGNHIMSNRKGTHVFKIESRSASVMDWGLLGYTIGRKLPCHAIPVIDGNFSRPDLHKIKACYAAMAETGGPEMCHIVGITPEAMTLDQACGGKPPRDVMPITEEDLDESLADVSAGGRGEIDFISLGCPHYSIEEIRLVADFLDGKRISSQVELQVWTVYGIKAIADLCGYTEKIRRAGGVLLTSSCPVTHGKIPQGARGMAFDSAKQAHSIAPITSAPVYFGSAEDCLKSALSGKWEGR